MNFRLIAITSLLLTGSFFFQSCQNATSPATPALGDVTGVTATPGGKSVALSWTAVPDATGYSLFFTSDGTEPTTKSSKIDVTGLTYNHSGLDDALTYKYLVEATASGHTPSMSTVTAARPNNTLTVTLGTSGSSVKFLLIPLRGDAATVWTDSATFTNLTPITGTTDASGALTLTMTIDRTHIWGWTVVKDKDAGGTLTTGDEVWGGGAAGSYKFIHYTSLVLQSDSETYNPWNYDSTSKSSVSHFF